MSSGRFAYYDPYIIPSILFELDQEQTIGRFSFRSWVFMAVSNGSMAKQELPVH